jgi:hypothetical protein
MDGALSHLAISLLCYPENLDWQDDIGRNCISFIDDSDIKFVVFLFISKSLHLSGKSSIFLGMTHPVLKLLILSPFQ